MDFWYSHCVACSSRKVRKPTLYFTLLGLVANQM